MYLCEKNKMGSEILKHCDRGMRFWTSAIDILRHLKIRMSDCDVANSRSCYICVKETDRNFFLKLCVNIPHWLKMFVKHFGTILIRFIFRRDKTNRWNFTDTSEYFASGSVHIRASGVCKDTYSSDNFGLQAWQIITWWIRIVYTISSKPCFFWTANCKLSLLQIQLIFSGDTSTKMFNKHYFLQW